jgi:hypothetical protein
MGVKRVWYVEKNSKKGKPDPALSLKYAYKTLINFFLMG